MYSFFAACPRADGKWQGLAIISAATSLAVGLMLHQTASESLALTAEPSCIGGSMEAWLLRSTKLEPSQDDAEVSLPKPSVTHLLPSCEPCPPDPFRQDREVISRAVAMRRPVLWRRSFVTRWEAHRWSASELAALIPWANARSQAPADPCHRSFPVGRGSASSTAGGRGDGEHGVTSARVSAPARRRASNSY